MAVPLEAVGVPVEIADVLAFTVALLLVTFLIPISAVLLGFLFLGEQLEPRHFAGMGLIALGLAAIDGRLLAFRRTP